MFMFETLKLVPGGEIMGIEYEAIPILFFGLAALLMVLVPFLDRGLERTGQSPLFTAVGVVAAGLHGRHDRLGLPLLAADL